ncbi:hypothetical protein [Candidatus Hydrogenosomobacter endosymbioticus]|uniref:Uncharacterized protein n=1 Tax=Candidatus Hydrogenosomobacter endosymbioticus TaxID=2558174 RepID=A0ABM7V8W2_9PROT|nr:hypothetical protein [Candidatus Hydrogenosomobacter endosymbioticus]BDB96231.1 hypothetical protein HYD_3640 [Candidatus Hydrogenosomobacter endosymbioticus]
MKFSKSIFAISAVILCFLAVIPDPAFCLKDYSNSRKKPTAKHFLETDKKTNNDDEKDPGRSGTRV